MSYEDKSIDELSSILEKLNSLSEDELTEIVESEMLDDDYPPDLEGNLIEYLRYDIESYISDIIHFKRLECDEEYRKKVAEENWKNGEPDRIEYYKVYQMKKGKKTFDEFSEAYKQLERIIVPIWVGECDPTINDDIRYICEETDRQNLDTNRTVAWQLWVERIGNQKEAKRIFDSVNSVHYIS